MLRAAVIACCCLLPLGAGEVYRDCPDEYAALRRALEGGGKVQPICVKLDERIAAVLTNRSIRTHDDKVRERELLSQLFTLRGAATVFAEAPEKELALEILGRPLDCSRLLHAVDGDDDLPAFWRILNAFRGERPDDFAEFYELGLAFAVVWDQYQGHPWVVKAKGKAPADSWRRLLAHYEANRDKLRLNPKTMPHELGVYVVAVRLDAAEIEWALKTYGAGVKPNEVYFATPWTKKLSPLAGTGKKIAYTLPNIRRYGGACYEQAYSTESVMRLYGLPVTMAIGRGKRGTHAWVGALKLVRPVRWNFGYGRYSFDHYFKGDVEDPTAPGKVLPDSSVMLTAALMTAGSRENIELGHVYLEAAQWVLVRSRTEPDVWGVDLAEALLEESLELSPYAVPTWDRLRDLAAAGTLPDERLLHWGASIIKRAARHFPDYTAEWLVAAIAGAEQATTKRELCDDALKALARRPDLVAELKVVEGDLHLAAGDHRKAVASYSHPLRRFAKDGHALDAVKERIATLGDAIPEAADRERVYLDLLKLCPHTYDKNKTLLRETRAIILDRLIAHYKAAGDKGKVARYTGLRKSMK